MTTTTKTPWKLSPDGESALRTLEDGVSQESRMIESIPANELVSALPADPPDLATVKLMQIATLTQSYQSAITQPVSYMSTTFQTDPASVSNLTHSLAAMTPGGATPSGFYWIDASNNHVAMSLAQLQGFAAAMYAPGWVAFQNLQAKKASVNAASTVSDVQSITF